MTRTAMGAHGGRRMVRRAVISVCLAFAAALVGVPPAGALPLHTQRAMTAAGTVGARQHPNRFDPRTRADSVPPRRPRAATPARRGVAAPQPFHRDMGAGSAPMIVPLDPARPGRFSSKNGGLEVDVPAAAARPADVSAAGGSMRLLVRQVLPASGGSTGRYSFGTFLVQVLDAHGHLARGLRRPLTFRLHYGRRASALNLARTQAIINGGLPPWVNPDPAAVPGVVAGPGTSAAPPGARPACACRRADRLQNWQY
jgi:hypothetical protein